MKPHKKRNVSSGMLKLSMLVILSGWAEISNLEDTAFPEIWNVYVKYLGKIWTQIWLLPAKMMISSLLNRFGSPLDETPAPSPTFLNGSDHRGNLDHRIPFLSGQRMKTVCLLKNSVWKKYWCLPGHLQKKDKKITATGKTKGLC